jgi:exopolysaccharide/PEP-CTERM locus tyrosine autokinase
VSKIQEALRRLQQTGNGSGAKLDSEGDDLSATLPRIATPVPRMPVDSGISHISTNMNTLVVDREALRTEGLLAPQRDTETLARQYRAIKRPLIRHAFGKRATKIEDGNLIMVSSAVAGEGKTFTSINLALSMAQERDHSVILVDADVAKPHVSNIFGVSGEPGLLDLLEDSSLSPESLIMATDVEHLFVLPAGRPRPNATELLASKRMEVIASSLAKLAEQPLIIFDSPPLLRTSEAGVVATLAGQVLIVVRAGQTSHQDVLSALSMMGEDKAVNMVLNQASEGGASAQYGVEYGYGAQGSEMNQAPLKSEQGHS